MDEERREWLRKALETAFNGQVEDQNVRLKRALVKLAQSDAESDQSQAIDEIDACADYPDCCDNFAKLDGITISINFLQKPGNLKSRFLSVLSLYVANNPHVQLAAWEGGLLRQLLEICSEQFSDSDLPLRAVGALGAVVRGVDALERGFISANGRQFLQNLMTTTTDDRVQAKCQTLLDHLALID